LRCIRSRHNNFSLAEMTDSRDRCRYGVGRNECGARRGEIAAEIAGLAPETEWRGSRESKVAIHAYRNEFARRFQSRPSLSLSLSLFAFDICLTLFPTHTRVLVMLAHETRGIIRAHVSRARPVKHLLAFGGIRTARQKIRD